MDIAVPLQLDMPRRCHGVRPRFPEEGMEAAYRIWRAEHAMPFARVGAYASIAGWATFSVASVLIGPELARLVIPAAVIFVVPLIAAVLATVHHGPLMRFMLPATAIANACGGVITVLILRRSGVGVDGWQFADVGTATAVLYVYYACTIMRLPPGVAALAISPYVLLQQFFLFSAFDSDPSRRIAYTAVLWVAVMSGLWLSWALERVWRDSFHQERLIEAQQRVIAQERERAEQLLHNILPISVADELKAGPGTIAESHRDVTVLFADVVGFTPLASSLPAEEVVVQLNKVFSLFDELCARHGVEKIKTIGDAYMAVAGLPLPREDHAEACADLALAMRAAVSHLSESLGQPLDFRIGMHAGPVVAGVIGTTKFAYDLWGDTVNVAARMESHGLPGAIQVSDSLAQRLCASGYRLSERGLVDIKGKGEARAWLLEAPPDQTA